MTKEQVTYVVAVVLGVVASTCKKFIPWGIGNAVAAIIVGWESYIADKVWELVSKLIATPGAVSAASVMAQCDKEPQTVGAAPPMP